MGAIQCGRSIPLEPLPDEQPLCVESEPQRPRERPKPPVTPKKPVRLHHHRHHVGLRDGNCITAAITENKTVLCSLQWFVMHKLIGPQCRNKIMKENGTQKKHQQTHCSRFNIVNSVHQLLLTRNASMSPSSGISSSCRITCIRVANAVVMFLLMEMSKACGRKPAVSSKQDGHPRRKRVAIHASRISRMLLARPSQNPEG